jgi:ADP-ribose pyrophosphatase YjhB (NUDIX family)
LLLNHVLRPASGWGIPGGFLKAGEQPIDSARREIFEETGLELRDLKLITAHTLGRHIEILFAARSDVDVITLKSREIIGFQWFEPEKLPTGMNRLQRSMIEQLMIKIREKHLI